jgi:hypothetical protein
MRNVNKTTFAAKSAKFLGNFFEFGIHEDRA